MRVVLSQRQFVSPVLQTSFLVTAFLVCLFAAGCPGPANDIQEIETTTSTRSDGDDTADEDGRDPAGDRLKQSQCERKLQTAVAGMSYDRLDIDAERAAQLTDLNAWATICEDAKRQLASDEEVRNKIIPEGMRPYVNDSTFIGADLLHIRDSKLSDAIGAAAVTDAGNDVRVMTDLFARVVRHIQLIDSSNGELPFDPFEIWQTGIGTARDRMWTFALLLRQYQIDAVALEFPSGFNAEPYLLVAAITRGEEAAVYLFDPITGLPIPKLSDKGPIPTQPATWSEAAKNDQVFRQLDQGNQAFPLRSDRLETAKVFIIGDVPLFAPRMAAVQDALPGAEAVQLYSGLGPNELTSPGLVERIRSAIDVEVSELSLWPHGLVGRLQQTSDAMPQAMRAVVENRSMAMAAPFMVVPAVDEKGQPVVDENGNQQMQLVQSEMQNASNMRTARIAHLAGDYVRASKAYLAVRIADSRVTPNQLAASDASYWSGVFQYESSEIETKIAKDSLLKFLTRNDRLFREASVRRLLAEIYISEGDIEEAVKVTFGGAVDPGTIALVNRWKRLGLLTELEAAADEKSEPAGEKPPAKADTSGTAENEAMTKEAEAESNEPVEKAADPDDKKDAQQDDKPAAKKADAAPADEPAEPSTETAENRETATGTSPGNETASEEPTTSSSEPAEAAE